MWHTSGELVRKGATFCRYTKTNIVQHKNAPGGRVAALYRFIIMRQDLSLKCFSPLVMIATFVFEMVAALIVLLRYRHLKESKLVIAILVCLAVFQLAEYMICVAALGLSSLDWARVGWVAISFLPPLGVHLGLTIAGKQQKLMIVLGYAIAVVFSVYFLAIGHGMQGSVCTGNYIIFDVAKPALYIYMAYYYVWLITGAAAAFLYAGAIAEKPRREALQWLGVGYALFIIPTITVNMINPATMSAIPSIMCGFAVLLALVLLFAVTPRLAAANKDSRKKP